ncbi:MAG: PilZ domain-containing protein [Sphingomonas sp.]
MALAAHLYRDARWAERHQLERDATLRDPNWAPIDAMVDDLSETGFRVTTLTAFEVGAEIGLGLSGIGTRQARIVRRAEYSYGCEFLTSLTAEELHAARNASPVEPIALPQAEAHATPVETPDYGAAEDHPDRLPLPLRALAIAIGAILAWTVLAATAWLAYRLASSLLPA